MSNLLPPLAKWDLDELRESIRQHGVREPIVQDEFGKTIDGHHRETLAAELGVDCPVRVVTGLTEPEKWDLAYALNVPRRHLTIEQRREIWEQRRSRIATALQADPRRSDRSIAEEIGASHPTVAAVREELEENGKLSKLERRGRGEPEEVPAINVADHRNEVYVEVTIGYPCESEEMRRRGDKPYPQESDRLSWQTGRQYLIAPAPRTHADEDALVAEIAGRVHREMRLHPLKTVAMALR